MPARRNDNNNTYQYGVRDGVVRDEVGIVLRSGVVVRFELGELGDSRVWNGIRTASSVDHEFPKLQDHK